MNNKNWTNKKTDNLFKTILALKDVKEARRFFRDLLTEKEIVEFANRWEVAQMLDKGFSYSKIEKETGMSSTTIARISKWLNSGMSGYRLMIDRLSKTATSHNHEPAKSSLEDGS